MPKKQFMNTYVVLLYSGEIVLQSYVVKMKDFDLKLHIIRKNYIFNFYGRILIKSMKNLLGQNAQYTTRYIP